MNIPQVSEATNERPFLAKPYFAVFLRKCGVGQIEVAREYAVAALRLSPALEGKLEELITDWAVKQTYGPPQALAQVALSNLPDRVTRSGQIRQRILGKINIAKAFDEYQLGRRAQVWQYVFKSLRYDPSSLKNKRVIAILVRSLLNRQARQPQSMPDFIEPDDQIPPFVISGIESALRCSIHSALRITSGESGARIYLIKTGEREYMLRVLNDGKNVLKAKIHITDRIRAAGVPTPAILASSLSAPNADQTSNWLLEERIPGVWFERSNLSPADELTALADLGLYLRRVHQIQTVGFGLISSASLEAPYNTFEAWLESQQQGIIRACLTGAIPETVLPSLSVADQLLRGTYSGPPVLCHADLSNTNILVEGGRVSAIIDWGDATGTDPAYDIAQFFLDQSRDWYPVQEQSMLATLLEAYGVAEFKDFYYRIIAHRILFIANRMAWLVEKHGYNDIYQKWLSILTSADQALAHRM